jgi:hypothetical protein
MVGRGTCGATAQFGGYYRAPLPLTQNEAEEPDPDE